MSLLKKLFKRKKNITVDEVQVQEKLFALREILDTTDPDYLIDFFSSYFYDDKVAGVFLGVIAKALAQRRGAESIDSFIRLLGVVKEAWFCDEKNQKKRWEEYQQKDWV